MAKNKKKSNILLKQRSLLNKVKKAGIKRISPDALNLIKETIEKILDKILAVSREEMLIAGRRTLKEEDIKKSIERFEETREANWEI